MEGGRHLLHYALYSWPTSCVGTLGPSLIAVKIPDLITYSFLELETTFLSIASLKQASIFFEWRQNSDFWFLLWNNCIQVYKEWFIHSNQCFSKYWYTIIYLQFLRIKRRKILQLYKHAVAEIKISQFDIAFKLRKIYQFRSVNLCIPYNFLIYN